MAIGFKKVAANEALIVTGSKIGKEGDPGVYLKNGRMIRVIRGGSVFITPFQSAESVSLNSMQIKLTTPRIVTNEGVPIRVWATATIKIADDLDSIVNYAEQFLGKEEEQIKTELKQILEGNLRTIVAKLTALEVNNSRDTFVGEVRKIAEKELEKMGFSIVSLVLDDVKDDNESDGYLVNLGIKTIAQSKRDAEIARSDAEREIANKKAINEQETSRQKDISQMAIAESNKERQLNETAIEEETSKAKARSEQAYALEQARLQQALVAEQTKVKLLEEQSQLEIKELAKKSKEKDAEIVAQEERIRANSEAEISERKALAEANAIKYQAEAENHALQQKGKAEAEIIRQRGLAEAEAKERMAEAMAKFGQAAVTEMIIKVLPEVARAISEPLSNINEVKVFDMGGDGKGNGNGMQSFAGTSLGMLGIVQDVLKETTGINMKEIVESNASYGRNQLIEKSSVKEVDEPTNPTDETGLDGDLPHDTFHEKNEAEIYDK